MLCVRMLGVLTISAGGQRVVDDLGPSGRALSGFLFEFTGRVHRRERLADQFWSHLDPERARAALNTALWRFRRLLAREPRSEGGRNLVTSGNEVVLEPAPWLDVDSLHFSQTVKHLLDQPERTSHSIAGLRAAIERYSGPFLDGEDADWILEERERLHSLYIRAATELVRCYGRARRYEEAIDTARTALTADPFRESLHRDLMFLLLLNEQRYEALRQHERWSAMLRQEIGIEPMPQTLRLIDDIRSGRILDRLDALKVQQFPPLADVPPAPSGEAAPLRVPQSGATRERRKA